MGNVIMQSIESFSVSLYSFPSLHFDLMGNLVFSLLLYVREINPAINNVKYLNQTKLHQKQRESSRTKLNSSFLVWLFPSLRTEPFLKCLICSSCSSCSSHEIAGTAPAPAEITNLTKPHHIREILRAQEAKPSPKLHHKLHPCTLSSSHTFNTKSKCNPTNQTKRTKTKSNLIFRCV